MAVAITLAAHNLNDGTTYTLVGDEVTVEPLGVSANIVDNAADGSQQQVNVKTKCPSSISFTLKVASTTDALLDTALDNLDAWCLAGGTFVLTSGGSTLLSCTVGVSTPPARIYKPESVIAFWQLVNVELVRMT